MTDEKVTRRTNAESSHIISKSGRVFCAEKFSILCGHPIS